MIDLKGKVALVTGASRGIGRATAIQLARAGAEVVINYHTDRHAAVHVRRCVEGMGGRAKELAADVSEFGQVEAMVAAAVGEYGRLDILVNNAGLWEYNPLTELAEARLRRTIDTNLVAAFYTCRAAVPHMKAQSSGVIINVSSTAGQRGEAYYSPYAATKSALIALTKSLAVELAEHNIRVNCVAPGWVATDMTKTVLSGPSGSSIRQQIPLGRVASPEEVAGPVAFLASDLASFITGEVLNVNGGAVLCG